MPQTVPRRPRRGPVAAAAGKLARKTARVSRPAFVRRLRPARRFRPRRPSRPSLSPEPLPRDPGPGLGRFGQQEREGAAASGVALQLHAPLVRLHDVLDDR